MSLIWIITMRLICTFPTHTCACASVHVCVMNSRKLKSMHAIQSLTHLPSKDLVFYFYFINLIAYIFFMQAIGIYLERSEYTG